MDLQSLLELQRNLERSRDKLFSDEQQGPEVYNKKLVSLLQPIVQFAQNPQLPVTDSYQALVTLTIVLSRISKSPLKTKTDSTASGETSLTLCEPTGDNLSQVSKDDFVRMFSYMFKSNQQLLAKPSKECFSAFMSAFPKLYSESEQGSFGENLAARLVSSDRNDKGEYYMLDMLVSKKWVSAEFILRKAIGDRALDSLISNLSNRSIGTILGKFIAQLLIDYRLELEGSSNGSDKIYVAWLQFFQCSLVEGMARDDVTRAHIEHYVLPRIFKGQKQAFIEFIKNIPLQTSRSQESLSTALTCLKVGQSQGWVVEHEVEQLLPTQFTLSRLVAHPSSHVRLMSLELLVETPSNKRPLPRSSLDCLRECLDDYFAETDPDFRGKVFSIHRYLMERLLGSSYAVSTSISKIEDTLARKKSLKTKGDAQEDLSKLKRSLEDQKIFIDWMLAELLPSQLRIRSSYQRNILALKVFALWLTAPDKDRRHVETMKKTSSRDANVHFPFSLKYDTPKFRRLLVEKVMDPFEDVRSIAASLLKKVPGSYEIPYAHIFERAGGALSTTGRASDADGVSRFIEIIFDVSLARGEIVVPELWNISLYNNKDGRVAESIFDWAISVLESNLQRGTSADGPSAMHKESRAIFGILRALRLIFERRDFFNLIARGNEAAWIERMLRIFSSCELIWNIVRDVLCIDSPTEGFDETIEDDVMESDPAPEAYNKGIGSHSVLNFCWRAISESSALLETMLKLTPRDSVYISSEFLLNSGRLFLTQLSAMRHRGSLLAVSPAFLAACAHCFNDKSPEVQRAPVLWLNEEMNNIGAKSSLVTRKSAGLPMIITAVISASLNTKNSTLEKTLVLETFTKLKIIAETMLSASEAKSLKEAGEDSSEEERGILDAPQVHALNTMRQLFLDSHLNMSMESLVPEALRISISSFSSDLWPVRNCGIMLFTTLLLRIFGSGADKAVYTVKSFFERFAGAQDLVIHVLERSASSLDGDMAVNLETVYPALSLISRLHRKASDEVFSAMEERMRELILQFLGSRIWKVRDAAAKAFVPLVEDSRDAELWIEVFLDWACDGNHVDRNMAHGGLLAARYLIEFEKRACTGSDDDRWKNIAKQIGTRFKRFIDSNHQSNAVITATYLQLLNRFVLSTTDGRNTLLQEETLLQSTMQKLRAIATSKSAGAPLFNVEMARSVCLGLPTEAVNFLHGYGSEVGQAVAETIRPLQLKLEEARESKIWECIEDNAQWEPYRVSLLRLLCESSLIHKVGSLERALGLVETGNMVNVQEAALVFCGKLIPNARKDLVSRWYLSLHKFSHENEPHSSRMSALKSIHRYVESTSECEGKEKPKTDLLPTYFVLYKLLNDDEDDIRNEAASVTSMLLSIWGLRSRSDKEAKEQLTSIVASHKLLQILSQNTETSDSQYTISLMSILLQNILSISSLDNPSEVSTQLNTATAKNTLLFKFEKQNLYDDQVRNMSNVTEALLSIKLLDSDALLYSASVMGSIEEYTRQALTKLSELYEHHSAMNKQNGITADGYLGWTTTTGEDLFILGLRCTNAFWIGCKLMKTIGVQTLNPSEWSNIVAMARSFVSKGELPDESINEFWLEDFRKGLCAWDRDSQSVVG